MVSDMITITPAMQRAICASMRPGLFLATWIQYNETGARRSILLEWAGDDPEKLKVVEDQLSLYVSYRPYLGFQFI